MSVASSEVDQQISSIVASDHVVLFMKGNRQAPQCGFSAQVIQILDRVLPSYETFDVLSDMGVREGIKSFSDWPTIPQLYIGGEFQGGCDIIREMYEAGELHQALGIERPDPEAIDIQVSEGASKILTDAQERNGGEDLHIGIDASFTHSFAFGPPSESEVTVQVGELRLVLVPDHERSLRRQRATRLLAEIGVDRVATRLMAKLPDDRYASAEELLSGSCIAK